MNKSTPSNVSIPNWIVWVQAICFSVLYAIWALPETILIRHICLIIGALLSLWIIYQNRYLFFQKCAIPIWLIVALFAWITFHLFFLSTDFAAQYEEYTSIWKRVALGAIFAVGFGITLSSLPCKKESTGCYLWMLMYIGLLAPTLIYIIKFILTNKAKELGIVAPEYLLLYHSSAPYYLPKTAYVCFCLPTLGIALGQLVCNIHRHQIYKWGNVIYLATIPAILFVFYAENIKNGMVYSVALLLVFFGALVFRNFRRHWIAKLAVIGIVLVIGSVFVANSIRKNDSWRAFVADVKVAKDTQTYPQWKFNVSQSYPKNKLGSVVSSTIYERLAWGKVGLGLIAENPLGFGLVEQSFGSLAKINWPDSKLHQSHSGWIDLGLGIGIPGLLLILGSLLLSLHQLALTNRDHNIYAGGNRNRFKVKAQWVLFSLLIMWCSTELSQKIFFDDLIFWLSLGGGIALGLSHGENEKLRQ